MGIMFPAQGHNTAPIILCKQSNFIEEKCQDSAQFVFHPFLLFRIEHIFNMCSLARKSSEIIKDFLKFLFC